MKKSFTVILAALLCLFATGCTRPYAFSTPAPAFTAAPTPASTAFETRYRESRLITSGCVMDKMAISVILVDFTDVACSTTDAQWSAKFFGQENSLRSFYATASNKMMDIVPVSESFGENDGVVRVQLSRKHPNALEMEKDGFTQRLVNEILRRADGYIDFSGCDQNGDNILWPTEFTPAIVLAGYEQDFEQYESDPSVGAHMHFTNEDDYALYLDNSSIEAYIMLGELVYDYVSRENRLNTVEIIAHETGHALGLPDLYDLDESSLGVGIHSTMGGCIYQDRSGRMNENPVDLDAWSKLFLGFAKPQVITRTGEYILFDGFTGTGNILLIPTRNPDEYFLLENRQFTGYDAVLQNYLSRSGVCIWHINNRYISPDVYDVDGFVNISAVNGDEDHKGVDIEEANEAVLGYAQLDEHVDEYYADYDHYFSAAGIRDFNADSHPSTALNSGDPTGISIRVLSDGPMSRVKIDFKQ
ncbi:MAG: M6 family metalloprotease domain-containing protein [Bacillota bacterium]